VVEFDELRQVVGAIVLVDRSRLKLVWLGYLLERRSLGVECTSA
jgi:hypothetical protein